MPKTPETSRAALQAMGFKVVTYNVLLPAVIHALRETLIALKSGDLTGAPPRVSFDEMTELAGLADYTALETRYIDPEP
jgi:2-methylisocitrate lyase-like PEP mutase family enzyme